MQDFCSSTLDFPLLQQKKKEKEKKNINRSETHPFIQNSKLMSNCFLYANEWFYFPTVYFVGHEKGTKSRSAELYLILSSRPEIEISACFSGDSRIFPKWPGEPVTNFATARHRVMILKIHKPEQNSMLRFSDSLMVKARKVILHPILICHLPEVQRQSPSFKEGTWASRSLFK